MASVLQGTLLLIGLMSAAWTDLRRRQIYDLSSIVIAGAGLISFSPARLLGLVLALVLYCLFYLAIAALHKIRRQERPPESYPFAPFLAVGFFAAYII